MEGVHLMPHVLMKWEIAHVAPVLLVPLAVVISNALVCYNYYYYIINNNHF